MLCIVKVFSYTVEITTVTKLIKLFTESYLLRFNVDINVLNFFRRFFPKIIS